MTLTLDQIWRYPIKAIGAEALDKVALTQGRPLPLDRAWAVLEQGGDDSDGWRSCRNFLRGAKGPALMGVMARIEQDVLHLTHPDRPPLALPLRADSGADLIAWLGPIYPDNRQPPVALVKSPDEGMADVPFASVSIMNPASLAELSEKAGKPLDRRRFRGNLWLTGLPAWAEFDLIGKTLSIGDAKLTVAEPITRCRATEANPETGLRDINTLQILESGWGHTDFGVNAKVRQGGTISVGDRVTLQ